MTTTEGKVSRAEARQGAHALPDAMATAGEEPDPRRWWGLVTIALAQLMVVLDITIVNIALPSAQRDLGMSNASRQWVITAYTLAFGGLLLLGGRIADRVGRKRTFITGLIGFSLASAAGGAAVNSEMLFGARGLQGVFAALLAPSALSLLTTTFTDPRERGKAFGIYSAIAGGGSAVGLIAGGVLTEYLDWRWCLFVNVPIGLIAVIGGLFLLHDRPGHSRGRLDLVGVVLGCGGLVALVYGFTEAETRAHGWADHTVLGLLIGGVLLLVLFAVVEARIRNPLLPLRVVSERNRGGSFLAVGLSTISLFGVFLFLTYYLQVDLGYTPVMTGLAFLPLTAAIILSSTQLSARLLPRVGARWLMAPGLFIAAGGMAILTQLSVNGDYASQILPALLLLGFGLGMVMMPAMSTATFGVAPSDAGVTSATVNTAQQVGGSIGTALLNTIAISATSAYVAANATGVTSRASRALLAEKAQVHGYTVAIIWSMVVLLMAALVAVILVNGKGQRSESREAVPAQATAEDAPYEDAPGHGSGTSGYGASTDAASAAGPGLWFADGDTHPAPASEASAARGTATGVITHVDGVDPLAGAERAADAGVHDFFDGTESPGVPLGGTHLRGLVRNPGGAPVGEAMLTLVDTEGRQRSRTVSAADGRYTLAAPAGGTYVLIAAAHAHQPRATTLDIGEGPCDHDVLLAGSSGVAGIVRGATDGAPVARALVVLLDAAGSVTASTTTGIDGAYAFTNLLTGDYTLAVSQGTRMPVARPLTVADGEEAVDVELSGGTRLHGIVSDDEGLPVDQARVTVTTGTGRVVAAATTSRDGSYAFGDLPAGDYTVTAVGFPPSRGTVSLGAGGRSRHDVRLAHTG